MPTTILGLDIGGANLKAATAGGRAVSVPFALWKQPDRLPAALAELAARFPDAEEFAVTMTGELCDCYETKRQGVNAILDAVEFAASGRPARVWGTDGTFLSVAEARAAHLTVAASNWHALATFAGRFAPTHGGLLIDIGSTTADIIPLHDGVPATKGSTDIERLRFRELVYLGVRRTPVSAVYRDRIAAELFATTQDVCVVLGLLPEDPADRDTADGRPATVEYSLARLARMLGGDAETIPENDVIDFAVAVHREMVNAVAEGIRSGYYDARNPPELRTLIVSGAGEFLARRAADDAISGAPVERIVSLNEELGREVSACAPAYALAVLAAETV